MDLKQKLREDLIGAMKSKNSLKVDTLRLLTSEIKNKEIDLRKDLGDEDILSLVTTQVKKRKEAAALYAEGGRNDLKEKEEKELAILQAYLPEPVEEEVLRNRIQQVITEVGAQGMKDMGKVMKVVIPEFKGRADGGLVKNLVNELLGK